MQDCKLIMDINKMKDHFKLKLKSEINKYLQYKQNIYNGF